MMYFRVIFLIICLSSMKFFGFAQSESGWIAREFKRLEESAKMGAEYKIWTFNVYRLFWKSDSTSQMDSKAVTQYHQLIAKASELGLQSYGSSTLWVLPPFANAPLIPDDPDLKNLFHQRRLACIPELGSTDYRRIEQIRNEMWATLAREFSEINTWVIGNEANFLFYDCSGSELRMDNLVNFFADSQLGILKAIKSQNQSAKVIMNFLGRAGFPIYIEGKNLQPSELLRALLTELSHRDSTQAYDYIATVLEKDILDDRYPEPIQKSGWPASAYWIEEFDAGATTDLVGDADYDWSDIRTQTTKKDISVHSDEYAICQYNETSGTYVAAAVTDPGVDVVPNEYFESSQYERNRWTAVADFWGVNETQHDPAHGGVMFRVNDRTWDGNPDQTRFGTIVYSKEITKTPGCSNEACAGLQIAGDDSSDPTTSAGAVFYFSLDEFPWDYPTTLYRAQIQEREVYSQREWKLQWLAEVYEVGNSTLIGDYGWLWQSTVENNLGVDIPELNWSKLMFGVALGRDVRVDFERCATNYYEY